jgi:hypothetical protein
VGNLGFEAMQGGGLKTEDKIWTKKVLNIWQLTFQVEEYSLDVDFLVL